MMRTNKTEYSDEQNIGYAIVAILSDDAKEQIISLLNELSTELPNVLLKMQASQLHITLCEIIQPKPYTQDKEELYERHREEYENIPQQILAAIPNFTVTLDVIEASPQAIIVRSADPTSFNTIRSQLVQNMQFPSETRTPPDIIHSSIARYISEVDMEIVQKVIARHTISIKENITQFKLIRTVIPPLQKYDVVRTYQLA
jgi:DNA-binding NarL/FixJ family response regulator